MNLSVWRRWRVDLWERFTWCHRSVKSEWESRRLLPQLDNTSYMVYCEGGTFPSSEALLTTALVNASQYFTKPLKWLRYIMAAGWPWRRVGDIHRRWKRSQKTHSSPSRFGGCGPSTSKVVFYSRRPYQFRRRWRLRSSDNIRSHYTKPSRV